MLTADETAIIKATVPILEADGEALTMHFYKIMLDEYPQVRPLFNLAHQASGTQPRALANGVLMYAKNAAGVTGALPCRRSLPAAGDS
jgi:nitric oxide dioxygenase